jgi:GT2 family glycosyltransferase
VPVAIVGMHRSGTSMVARLLEACGLYLGEERDLMPPAPDNPEGFGENVRFVELNEEILTALGGGWDRPPELGSGWELGERVSGLTSRAELLAQEFVGREPWGWKDPRNSLTLPLWSRVADSLAVVACVRNPLEVALSLRRRNGISVALGLSLWAEHYERILATTVAESRILTHYDAYFGSARRELRRVADFVGLPVEAAALERAVGVAVPWLRHYRMSPSHLQRAEVPPKVVGLYHALCAEALWTEPDGRPPNGTAPGLGGNSNAARGRPEIHEGRTNVQQAHHEITALGPAAAQDGEVVRRLDLLEREQGSVGKELRALRKELRRGLAAAKRTGEAARRKRDREPVVDERERLAHKVALRDARLAEAQREAAALQSELEARDVELARLRAEAKAARAQDEELAQLLARSAAGQASPDPAGEQAAAPPSHALYEDLVVQIRAQVAASLPEDATILVVSRGDEEVLKLGPRTAWHFPQDDTGQYAGYYPATSEEAIAQLEAQRERGGQFILFPSPALWWLDHYAELGAHLERNYRLVLREEGVCAVFMLDGNPQPAPVEIPPARTREVAELVRAHEELALRLEEAEQRAEAASRDRLARARLAAFLAGARTLDFPETANARTSVVIPSFRQAHLLFQTLESLRACHSEEPFELVIVDNGSDGETHELLDRLVNVRVQRNVRNLGFGAACALGAQLSRGSYVCFLNNDTIVTPGWLQALVATLEGHAGCGAVGSRLVHPDGRLQEAGGIVWRDGSGWGYGRGLDPEAPEVTYPREVDYCSAASLLVRRDLFLRLGGFDERYAPAYYEDTDLCIALWAAGHKVVYEPRSVVFHLEYGSSGEERAVALHRRNQQKLAAKWESLLGDRLPPAAENCVRARDRRPERRVLVADDRVPNSGRGSGFPRARALLEALVELGFVVTFLPTTDPTPYQPETAQLQQLGVEVLYGTRDLEAALADREGLYDVAIVSRPHNAHLIEVVRRLNPGAAVVYDAEAVFAVREVLQAAVEGSVVPETEARELIELELGLMDGADLVMTVSEPERRLVRARRPSQLVEVWGDSVRPRRVKSDFRARRDLLFVGGLGTPPNADAVSHLLREIFPTVHRRLGCRLYVVGSSPAPGLFDDPASFGEGVVFTGFVEELAPVYDRARVFVAPHRFAAGAPHKVIEAMGHGVPCVVSQLLADQLEVTDGEEALVARDAPELVEKIARLYRDRRLWRRLQERGYRLVEERYDPDAMRRELSRIIDAAAAAREPQSDVRADLVA